MTKENYFSKLQVGNFVVMWKFNNGEPTMKEAEATIVEKGNAALIFSKDSKTIILESGNMYRKYGKSSEGKVKLIGSGRAPDFEQSDNAHFQKCYQYLGEVNVVKEKRTLRIKH